MGNVGAISLLQALEPSEVLNESWMHKIIKCVCSHLDFFRSIVCVHFAVLAEGHGIPEKVMLSYLQGEIEGEAAVKNLPATRLHIQDVWRCHTGKWMCKKPEAAILLIVWFLMMCLACTCLHLIFPLLIFSPSFVIRNLSHELPETIQSIEKAIDFDITELLCSSKKLLV